MRLPIVGLIFLSFAISWVLTFAMIRIAPRVGFVDKPGGRKIHANPKPLGGGVAIFWGFALPVLAGLAYIHLRAIALQSPSVLQPPDPMAPYIFGAGGQMPMVRGLHAAAFVV